MTKIASRNSQLITLLIVSLLFSGLAIAKKPGKDKYKHHDKSERYESERHEHSDDGDVNVQVDVYFGDEDRVIVRDYYEEREHKGHCPPGLAKKRNGCMPPGQAKKWHKGLPLPRDVIYHDLPPSVVVKLRLPPSGHKYVRVAADILLIAIGTGIVIDAIEDLGRI
jgi:Ni/Co efflux regulator RcnB